MFGSGVEASSLDAFVFLVVGPGLRRGVDGHPFISPLSKHGDSRVAQMVQFVGQVGGTAKTFHKFLPGAGLAKFGSEVKD